MRTICDVCESAPAVLFCAADEAALCRPCDEKRVEFLKLRRSGESINCTKEAFVDSSGESLEEEIAGRWIVAMFADCRCQAHGRVVDVSHTSRVHLCNKLASRHLRVGLADPNEVPRCDICESAPAFFYCEIDGSSLCLQCDMIVHVGGKRTHGRYLLLRQRVEFPGDKPSDMEDLAMQTKDQVENRRDQNQVPKLMLREKLRAHMTSTGTPLVANNSDHGKLDSILIDLNTKPNRTHGQTSNTQGMDSLSASNDKCAVVVPYGTFKKDREK